MSKVNIRIIPQGQNLLVALDPSEPGVAGGFFLPEMENKNKLVRGRIIAVSAEVQRYEKLTHEEITKSGIELCEPPFQKGDYVLVESERGLPTWDAGDAIQRRLVDVKYVHAKLEITPTEPVNLSAAN